MQLMLAKLLQRIGFQRIGILHRLSGKAFRKLPHWQVSLLSGKSRLFRLIVGHVIIAIITCKIHVVQIAVLSSRVLMTVINRLYAKVDNSSTNLDCLVVPWEKRGSLLNEHKSAELWLIVFKHEFAIFQLNFSMTSADRNVVDSQITFMASPKLENILTWCRSYNMNNSGGIFFLVQRFKNHEVPCLFFILHKIKLVLLSLHHEWVRFFADFAFKCLPEITDKIRRNFGLALDLQPVS